MFLSQIEIKNFRSIKETTLTFSKGLNVIIGRNNTGKTAVVDALRICLSYGKQWRDIYISKDDFHIDVSSLDSQASPIEFHLTFNRDTPEETGLYHDLLVQKENGDQEFQLHFMYSLKEKDKIKWVIWGGDNKGQNVSSDMMDAIQYVYLNPLRDAVASLRPVRRNRIGELFASLVLDDRGNKVDDDKKEELAQRLSSTVKQDADWTSLIKAGEKKIEDHLGNTSIEEDRSDIDLNFLPFEFRRIVDNIRVQLPIFTESLLNSDSTKQKYFQLSQNGLGYNNLIYIATVLGDLINKKEIEPERYFALLIEEPEAHLHPQLQNLFFEYMNQLKNKGIQLFITSHSPTITSKVELDSLLVLQKKDHAITNMAIRNSGLSDNNKKHLLKFLDVTKSQLFFANGVILVEGISEALLLPVIAKKAGYNLVKSGIEVVNIGGVAFEHFAKLFNNDDQAKNLAAKCAIVTDDDKQGNGDISDRAKNTKEYEKQNLKVVLADVTFEKEIFDQNKALVKTVYGQMHIRTQINDVNDLLDKLKSNKDKSELAHNLSVRLSESQEDLSNFTVPEYIQKAIKWVIEGE